MNEADKTVQMLFLAWWLFAFGGGFIAFLCTRGFWKDYRLKKAAGDSEGAFFAFWSAALFLTMAAEAAVTVIASPFTSADNPPVAGLVVALVRRTLLSLGIWLWWLKVVR